MCTKAQRKKPNINRRNKRVTMNRTDEKEIKKDARAPVNTIV